jgi:hypothetical protein
MRRLVTATLCLAACAMASDVPGISIRGTLTHSPGKQPALDPGNHKPIYLKGDHDTMEVLNDDRLAGADFEAIGHFTEPDRFTIEPITSKSMFVHKDGKRLMITYWCDICYIRTYSPGKCVCCQKNTDLDLRDRDEP